MFVFEYSTFLCTDPKALLLTKDSYIHHSKFHVWNKEKHTFTDKSQFDSDLVVSLLTDADIPLKKMASPPG